MFFVPQNKPLFRNIASFLFKLLDYLLNNMDLLFFRKAAFPEYKSHSQTNRHAFIYGINFALDLITLQEIQDSSTRLSVNTNKNHGRSVE